MQQKYSYIRLPLDGTYNTRDLGGYATKSGAPTKFNVFLRSDQLSDLTSSDIETLVAYGVTDVIDLRSAEEVEKQPDAIPDGCGLVFHHISFEVSGMVANLISAEGDFDMGDGYMLMIAQKQLIKTLFDTIYDAKGAVLFHCMAGKDRTGMLAMFLLGLVGVSKSDIIANYEVSHTHNSFNPSFVEFEKQVGEKFLITPPGYIGKPLAKIEEEGGIREYLLSCGIDGAKLDAIAARFV